MQDGAARLLQLHLTTPELSSTLSEVERKVFSNAFDRLISRDPRKAWTSGQWMTERPGGSDVSQTETTAVLTERTAGMASKQDDIPLGPWSVNGFKWFSSATDSQMTVLLAKTPKGGLSAFLAPMRKQQGDADCLNGVKIQRLKHKLGTRSLPTAELILEDMRGWLIGTEGRGIHEISTVLTLTRVHSAIAAVGYVGRGLAIARAFSKVREIGAGKGARINLTLSPLHMRTMAKMHSEYRGLILLTLYTSYVLGLSEHPDSPPQSLSHAQKAITPTKTVTLPLLRVLSQLTKAYVCKASVQLLFASMESLGGVGYLENEESEYLNVARLYRDCSVLPIWEGTTDVLSTDFIRALKHPKSGAASLDALEGVILQMGQSKATVGVTKAPGATFTNAWKNLRQKIESEKQGDLMRDAREILWAVGDLLVGGLLYTDAGQDGDEASADIYDRFMVEKFSTGVTDARSTGLSTQELLAKDSAIVFGVQSKKNAVARL